MHKNNLIAENRIIITTSDSFCFKVFAVVMLQYLTFTMAKVNIAFSIAIAEISVWEQKLDFGTG